MTLFGITFLWWWMFVLLPVPFIVRALSAKADTSSHDGALNVPFFQQLHAQVGTHHRAQKPSWWKLALLSLVWLSLVFALARPTLVGEKIALPIAGRDIMLAIDLSGSMDARDLGTKENPDINRLEVVKHTADQFIERRVGDRIGLIFFSNRAYLQSPLTFDRTVVSALLDEATLTLGQQIGGKTAIGDAIAIGLKRLRETIKAEESSVGKTAEQTEDKQDGYKDSRVLILLTDGANNAGVTDPIQATEIAKKLKIKIYTIGVGATSQVVNTFMGRQRVQNTDLDETTLKAIADATGGKYFRATDANGLDAIYQEIDKLEPVDRDPEFLRPEITLYYYPASLALSLLALLIILTLLPMKRR